MKKRTSRFPNKVIRASAGTGKTFALSNRFIGLALQGAPLDSILATTFTRKAAGEILDRVLERLARASLDDKACAELGKFVSVPDFSRKACLETLRRMLKHLHRLRVNTLDSFFIQIASSFSLELGIPTGWRIMDEFTHAQLHIEAIQRMLEQAKTEDLTHWVSLLQRTEATRSVTGRLKDLVGKLLSDFMEAPLEAWDSMKRFPELSSKEIEQAISAMESAPIPEGKRFVTTRESDLLNFSSCEWDTFLDKGFAKCILSGKTQYYRKDLPQELIDAYRKPLQHAMAVMLNRVVDQTQATGTLIRQIDAMLSSLKQQHRQLRFEDVTRLLIDAFDKQRLQGVDFRLDSRSSHLLLDEFQDTSPLQWRVLKPFAEKTVEPLKGRSFFCVGDVKQAIYGWRGGVAEIFDVITDMLEGLVTETMDMSYRSSPPVIEAVNRTFEKIDNNPALAKHKEAADNWAKRFSTHSTAHDQMPGYFRLESAPEESIDQSREDVCLSWAAARAAEMHDEDPDREIGILLRKNEAIAKVIRLLRTEHGIRASEEGGNPLTDSPAVELVLSLIRIADHPGDGPARFHVAHSPLGKHVGFKDHADDRGAWELSRRVRIDLSKIGYGPLLRQWAAALAGSLDRRDMSRLEQLVEIALNYDARSTSRTQDFEGYIRSLRVENPTADKVRVMTVHKSKGLQFDVVILPQLDTSLTGLIPLMVTGRPAPAEPIDRLCRYVKQKYRPGLPPEYTAVFDDHERRVVEESLCVLYVAMTRAEHALYLIIPPTKKSSRGSSATYEALLRNVFLDGEPAPPETILFELGDEHWIRTLKKEREAKKKKKPTSKSPASIRLARPSKRLSRNLERVRPSQLEGDGQVDPAERLKPSSHDALSRGTLIHAWFERIEWLEDFELDETALRDAAKSFSMSDPEMKRLLTYFRAALEKPELRALLSRESHEREGRLEMPSCVTARAGLKAPEWKVWQEKPFVIRENDAITSGIMDRLVVLFEKGKPVGAEIVDYKTDQIPPDDEATLQERVRFYSPQLKVYRQAAARLFGLDPDAVSSKLAFVDIGRVVSIE